MTLLSPYFDPIFFSFQRSAISFQLCGDGQKVAELRFLLRYKGNLTFVVEQKKIPTNFGGGMKRVIASKIY